MSYEINLKLEEGRRESASFGWNQFLAIVGKILEDSKSLSDDFSVGCEAQMEMGYFWITSEYSIGELSLIRSSLKSLRGNYEMPPDFNTSHVVRRIIPKLKGGTEPIDLEISRSFCLGLDFLISRLSDYLNKAS